MTNDQHIKDEAIKFWMENLSYKNRLDYFVSGYRKCMEEIAKQALSGDSSSGWVSVWDRLPDDRTEVLVFINNGYMVAHFKHGGFWFDLLEQLNDVTHWRELPPLPTDKNGEG